MEKEILEHGLNFNRRRFLSSMSLGLGSVALGSLMIPGLLNGGDRDESGFTPGIPHFAPKAKRVIYLFQNGAPSQLETFDYKPKLCEMYGMDLPPSVRGEQRLTGMTANQATFPLAASFANFKQYGKAGTWISDIMPYTSKIVDDICVIRSMYTEAINHDPALTFLQTGSQQGNRPSMGAWLSYGLGNENKNLPDFTVLLSRGIGNGQGVYSKLWSNGFLDSIHQGVQFSKGEDPVLYIKDPAGMARGERREMLDQLAQLNQLSYEEFGDPEITAKVKQYEMAYRMQTSVPEATSIEGEPKSVTDLYGPDVSQPGTFAANCLQARRLAERGVRFIQLYHPGWDSHAKLPQVLPKLAREVDQPCAGLITDLKQRGMLEDTLVICGGEFGRTAYSQGVLTKETYGRDHHPRCFSMWMAGGGVKPGIVHGATDDFGYNITENPVHVHDLHATILHLMGIDHTKLTHFHQGRHFRLTDVAGKVINGILA